jgi:predicted transposase YdaD
METQDQLSADEKAQQDRWQKARLDRLSQLAGAFFDGKQEGLLLVKIARKMKAINLSVDQIIECTGLTEEEISSL